MKHIQKLFGLLFMTAILLCLLPSCTEPHVHNWKAEITTLPECEKPGSATKTCIECGATETEVLAATGHGEAVEKTAVVATCTTGGRTDKVCPDCGKVFSTKETPALGHEQGKKEIVKAPTCTEAGEAETTCTRCGEKLENVILPATGHDMDHAEKEVIAEPTCTEDGKVNFVCPVCNVRIDNAVVPALGHLWNEAVITKNPTCLEEGSSEQVCARDPEHKKTFVLEKTPHVYNGTSEITLQATCTEPGSMITHCSTETCTATIVNVIPAKGHDMFEGASSIEKEATEFEDGSGTWKCKNCDYQETRVIPKTHKHKTPNDELPPWDYGNSYGNNIPGTCSEPGKIYGYCICYVDAEGNFYMDAGEGRTPYLLRDPETGEPYYTEGSMDPMNHVNHVSDRVAGKGYFAAGVNKTYCADCGNDATYTLIPGDKYSADGKWMTSGEHNDSSGTHYNYLLDIEAYPNGTDVFSYQIMGQDFGDYIASNSLGSEELFMHTIDGRWVSRWDTTVDADTGFRKFLLVKDYASRREHDSQGSAVFATDDSYENRTITFMMLSDFYLTIARQDLPNRKGIVGITATGLDSLTSFTKNGQGVNVISVSAGTAVNLKWVSLTSEIAGTITWTENGNTPQTGETYALKASSGTVTISCTGLGETHTFIIQFT